MRKNLEIGDSVIADILKNGYYMGSYEGKIVGFTNDGRVKVSSWKGIKCHSPNNLIKRKI